MPLMNETGQGKKIDDILAELKKLTERYGSQIKKDAEFKRKLESAISQIREKNGDVADKLDELIKDWNDL